MAWSDAARRAAAEASRRKRDQTSGIAAASYIYKNASGKTIQKIKSADRHTFKVFGNLGAIHRVTLPGDYSHAQDQAMRLARRVAARRGAQVYVERVNPKLFGR